MKEYSIKGEVPPPEAFLPDDEVQKALSKTFEYFKNDRFALDEEIFISVIFDYDNSLAKERPKFGKVLKTKRGYSAEIVLSYDDLFLNHKEKIINSHLVLFENIKNSVLQIVDRIRSLAS